MSLSPATLANQLDIHVNNTLLDPATWIASTPYIIGNTSSNFGNGYVVTVAGTSGLTGPSGTGTGIIDGTVTWDYAGHAAAPAWALAWTNYFYDATANGIPIPPGALSIAQTALENALVGFSTPSQGAAKIQAGLTAFWATLAASPPAIFPGSIFITPPPGLAGVPAALASQFAINNAPGITKTQALTNIANALHTTAGIGGMATFPPTITFNIL